MKGNLVDVLNKKCVLLKVDVSSSGGFLLVVEGGEIKVLVIKRRKSEDLMQ